MPLKKFEITEEQTFVALHTLDKEIPERRRLTAKAAAEIRKKNPRLVNPDIAQRRRLAGLLKSTGTGAICGKPVSIVLDLDVRTSVQVPFTARLAVATSEKLATALDSEEPLPTGKVRKDLVEQLRVAVENARASSIQRLTSISEAWTDRLDVISRDWPSASAAAFKDRLAKELARASEERQAAAPQTEDLVAAAFSSLLDRALVVAVNEHAQEYGTDDLRTRSGLADYTALFPEARAKQRKFLLHLGPTNSGKTHAAMDLLAAAPSGTYLAPLRLMALEGAERLNGERGIPTDMVTGEEEHRIEGARHVSSTIEMADLSTPVAVAIIDEIQMIADRDRGWAWTQALVGIPADIVVMTGSVDALAYVTRIAGMTGDKLEVVSFERMTPLAALNKPVPLDRVREGDAIIAFSRKEVLRIRDEVVSRGIQVATIYGALGPEVRRTQAARFRSGEAKVLVATDAIAMGLNLPIRRVLLSALSKYDGVSTRHLSASEIRQIGGRAGRYGLAERGEVGVTAGQSAGAIAPALRSVPKQPRDDRVPVMPPWPAVKAVSEQLLTENLAKILRHIMGTLLRDARDLRAASIDDALMVAQAVINSGLSLRDRFRYLGCPIDSKTPGAIDKLTCWAHGHAAGQSISYPVCSVTHTPSADADLAKCENAAKLLSAYLWLSMRWPAAYTGHHEAVLERDRVNVLIDGALRRKSLKRSCRKCGCHLPKKHKFAICDNCFHGC